MQCVLRRADFQATTALRCTDEHRYRMPIVKAHLRMAWPALHVLGSVREPHDRVKCEVECTPAGLGRYRFEIVGVEACGDLDRKLARGWDSPKDEDVWKKRFRVDRLIRLPIERR